MYTRSIPLVVLAAFLTSACDHQAPAAPDRAPTTAPAAASHGHASVELTPEMRQQLAALHPKFARYHDLQKATEDGYAFVGPCVSDPALGGMGDHYSLNADVDFGRGDGTYALDRPQYLVYAPQKSGPRRLASLDYTVPYEKWNSPEPPEFFGIPFTRNDRFGVWMFHISLETVSDTSGRTFPGEAWTDLVMTPERPLRAVSGMITGFHEPRATHLVIMEQVIAAAGGLPSSHLDRAYREAREAGYRWHEFGDSNLIVG